MKRLCLYIAIMSGIGFMTTSCADFLDREPITVPSNENFLDGEIQLRSYVNSLYTALPSLKQFGMGVRGEEKNSDNILSENYDKRLNGENTLFSSTELWETGYKNLRDVNYFFKYNLVSPEKETDEEASLRGEVLFLRAYWHFDLLKKFGDIPVMDGFWDEKATIEGLQIAPKDRAEVAKFILQDLEDATKLLFPRSKYQGLRISKEAAMMLAMQVSLYEGTWEKYHKDDAFAAESNQSEYFLAECMRWGDLLFEQGLTLETRNEKNPGDAFGSLFNKSDYTNVPEAVFWKKYSIADGVFHALMSLLGGGVVDEQYPAGVAGELVNTYLKVDGTFIDPTDRNYTDFNYTFKDRDPRLTETVMSSGYQFKAWETGSRPLNVKARTGNPEDDKNIVSPALHGTGGSKNVTGYHIRLGIDSTYVEGNSETGLIYFRYAEALLNYAEAAAELNKCTDEVLNKTLKPLRERAGVKYVKPTQIDPNFTDYGYRLSPELQEIRRERRVELALQGYRLDDLMRWAAHSVLVGKRGRGAYLGHDGVLYKSYSEDQLSKINLVLVDGSGWMDPLQELLPLGYQFKPDRDYLLPVPPSELELNKLMTQNPGWN